MNDETTTISVPLTVEERADRADIMAGLVGQIIAVKAQAKAKAFEFRGAIDALMDRLEEHARVLRAGEEERHQMTLTFPQEQAAQALHDVAAAACTCAGGPRADVKHPACRVHGVETRGPNPGDDGIVERVRCEGNHGAPQCADPECWLVEGPAEAKGIFDVPEEQQLPEPSNVVDLADARALKAAEVEVGTVEEPAAARAHRRRL